MGSLCSSTANTNHDRPNSEWNHKTEYATSVSETYIFSRADDPFWNLLSITNNTQRAMRLIHGYIMQIIYENASNVSALIIPIDLIKMVTSYAMNYEFFKEYGKCVIIKSKNHINDTIECESVLTFEKKENYKDLLGPDCIRHDVYSIYGNVCIDGKITGLYVVFI